MLKKSLLILVAGLTIVAAASMAGCGEKAAQTQETQPVEDVAPAETAPAEGDAAAGDVTELKIEDVKKGSGAAAKENDNITVHYTLSLTDGTKVESSRDGGQPATFALTKGQLIDGWVQGIPGMKVGGTRKLTIPPALGYGAQDMGKIPPNSTLVFDIELISIN